MSRAVRLRKFCVRLSASACTLAACAAFGLAQESGGRGTNQTRPRPAPEVVRALAAGDSSGADENFELNIAERRITENNFFASTEIGTVAEAGGGVNLRVGVAVAAERIDVTLRNVRGRVRFRASPTCSN